MPKTIRAKFSVSEITRSHSGREYVEIKMRPVYGNGDPDHENTKFYEATPG